MVKTLKRRIAVALLLVVMSTSVFFTRTVYASVLAYDVNGDGKCDDEDFAMVAELFGVNNPDPRYDPRCDVNDDRKINIKDLALVAKASGGGGFFVVPEYWLGTILGLIGCFAAFGAFRLHKGRLQ